MYLLNCTYLGRGWLFFGRFLRAGWFLVGAVARPWTFQTTISTIEEGFIKKRDGNGKEKNELHQDDMKKRMKRTYIILQIVLVHNS